LQQNVRGTRTCFYKVEDFWIYRTVLPGEGVKPSFCRFLLQHQHLHPSSLFQNSKRTELCLPRLFCFSKSCCCPLHDFPVSVSFRNFTSADPCSRWTSWLLCTKSQLSAIICLRRDLGAQTYLNCVCDRLCLLSKILSPSLYSETVSVLD
jgi:hypothetical protein